MSRCLILNEFLNCLYRVVKFATSMQWFYKMVWFILVANLDLEEVKREKRKMTIMMTRMVARFVTDSFALLADSFAFYFIA